MGATSQEHINKINSELSSKGLSPVSNKSLSNGIQVTTNYDTSHINPTHAQEAIDRADAYNRNSGSSVGGGGGSSGGYAPTSYNPQATQAPTLSPLEQLKQAQLAAAMAGLDKSKNASLSNLSAEKATIEPLYQKGKMQAGVTAKQTARSFDEYMAQRGGGAGASGIGGQGQLLNNMAYQRQYGELDQAEKGALTENARRVTDVGNAYNSDVQGANANVESQYLQNYIAQMNQDKQFGLQEAGLTGNYNGQSTLAKQQMDTSNSQWGQTFNANQLQNQFNNGISMAGITGQYNGTQTMAGKQTDASIASSNASTALNVAQLQEIQNPNSVTNQLNRLNLDTAKLNFAELPNTLKNQALKIAQDLQLGKIGIETAQQQLNFLPQQQKMELAQSQAQVNASNRSNTGGGGSGGGGGGSTAPNPKEAMAFNMQGLQKMASEGKTRTEILRHINENAYDLQANGTPVQELYKWAEGNFKWDKKDGSWYDVTNVKKY